MAVLIGVVVPAATFIFLTAVGIDLTADDFVRVGRERALVLTGLLAPLILLPPLALGLVRVFQPSPEIAAGVLLVAACPIGGISNAYSYLARASPALSVTLTGLSCLCAPLTIPSVGKGLELALGRPFGVHAPLSALVVQLLVVFALPLALGMWMRRRWADLAVTYEPALQGVAFVSVGIVLLLVIINDVRTFVDSLSTTVPLAAVFVVASFVVGWITATQVAHDRRDCFTIAAEFGTRNVGVATAIAVTLLGRIEFARFAATYFLTEIPLMLVAVALFRALGRRQWLQAAN